MVLISCAGGRGEAKEKSSNWSAFASGWCYYGEDSLEVVIAEFTTAQLQDLLGKPEPENVNDLFLLIPDEDCFDLSVADRKNIVEANRVSIESDFMFYSILENDITNNYLSVGGAFEGEWEMFSKKIDNTWRIAVNSKSCAPVCYTSIEKTYIYENNMLIRLDHANLAGYQNTYIEMFFNFDMLTDEQKEFVTYEWDDSDYSVLFSLPRDGKTISMYVDFYTRYCCQGIPEEAFKVVETNIWE